MELRHPSTVTDRLALAFAGGCFGVVLGGLLSLVFTTWSVVWYTAAYFAVVCLVLGPMAADIVVMVLDAIALLFVGTLGGIVTSSGYEKNPFDRPWHWVMLGIFFIGFAAVLYYAKGV